jgi:hypothetical protein
VIVSDAVAAIVTLVFVSLVVTLSMLVIDRWEGRHISK